MVLERLDQQYPVSIGSETKFVHVACRQPPISNTKGGLMEIPLSITQVLVIGMPDEVSFLKQGLDHVCRFRPVSDSKALFALLAECDEHPVVLANPEAMDITWPQLLKDLERVPNPPKLIIIARDHTLWGEILAQGGFDSIVRPVEPSRLHHLINAAHLAWTRDLKSVQPKPSQTVLAMPACA